MRRILSLAVAGIVLVVAWSPAFAAGPPPDLDAAEMFLLQYAYSNVPPDYKAMAEWNPDVRQADEFRRPRLIAAHVARLTAEMAVLRTTRVITVTTFVQLDPYDSQYGEYDLKLDNGSAVTFESGTGKQVQVALTNGDDANIWKLPPDEASAVLATNKGLHSVRLSLTLALLPSPPAAPNQPAILKARILRYDVYQNFGDVKLGSVVVPKR